MKKDERSAMVAMRESRMTTRLPEVEANLDNIRMKNGIREASITLAVRLVSTSEVTP